MNFADLLNEQMKDPEFRNNYYSKMIRMEYIQPIIDRLNMWKEKPVEYNADYELGFVNAMDIAINFVTKHLPPEAPTEDIIEGEIVDND
jgi:hypothetical protein